MLILCMHRCVCRQSCPRSRAQELRLFGADGETAGSVITIEWEQLIPGVEVTAGTTMRGIVEHSQITALQKSAPHSGLVSTFNGRQVRVPALSFPLSSIRQK